MDVVGDKKTQIVAAAIKRFSHYGIQKTSMSEIADDLKISGANLHYYFPDKFSLVEAVAEHLMDESKTAVDQIFAKFSGTLNLLTGMIDVKFEYFKKYHMLFLNLNQLNASDERAKKIFEKVFDREVSVITKVFQAGINSGELVTFDVRTKSELYVSIIRGLALFCDHTTPLPYMDMDTLSQVVQKQKEAAGIFVHGIVNQHRSAS